MFSLSSVTKIFATTVKGLETTTSCVRNQDATTAPDKTHVRDRVFKLSPIHASLIYQNP